MYRSQLLVILIFSSFTFGNAQGKTTLKEEASEVMKWENLSTSSYEIAYPSDWTIDVSKQMGTSFFLFSPRSNETDLFMENINLIIQDLTGYNLNLDGFVELSEDQVKTMITNGNILFSERQNKNKQEYHKIIYTGEQGIFDLQYEQYFWVIGRTAYVLTFTSEIAEWDQFKETGETILDSFKLK